MIEPECSPSTGGTRGIGLDRMDGAWSRRVLMDWISVMREREAGHISQEPLTLLAWRIEGHHVPNKADQ